VGSEMCIRDRIVIIIHYRSVSADILQNKHKKCCRIVVFSK